MQLRLDIGGGEMYAKHMRTTILDNGLMIVYNGNLA